MDYHLVYRFLFEFVGITDSFSHLVLPLRVKLHFYHKKCRVYSGLISIHILPLNTHAKIR